MKQSISISNFVIVCLILFFSIPLIYLILGGLLNSPFVNQWDTFTLDGFSEIFANSSLIHSLTESLLLALSSAIIGVLITTLYLSNSLFNSKKESNTSSIALSFPLALPDIIWGLSIVFLAKVLSISLGYNLVFLIHICFNVVLAYVFLKPVFRSYPKSQIKSSVILGASKFETITDVVLPNLLKQFIVVFVMCFLYSYDDFLLTFLLGGSDTNTLPLYLYSKLRYGASSSIISIASLTTIFNILLSVIIIAVTKKIKL